MELSLADGRYVNIWKNNYFDFDILLVFFPNELIAITNELITTYFTLDAGRFQPDSLEVIGGRMPTYVDVLWLQPSHQ